MLLQGRCSAIVSTPLGVYVQQGDLCLVSGWIAESLVVIVAAANGTSTFVCGTPAVDATADRDFVDVAGVAVMSALPMDEPAEVAAPRELFVAIVEWIRPLWLPLPLTCGQPKGASCNILYISALCEFPSAPMLQSHNVFGFETGKV